MLIITMQGLDTRACVDHYCNQRGGYFASEYPIQRGYGFLSALRRFAIPILKKTGMYLGKRLLSTGQNVMEDMDRGKSFKEASRDRFRESTQNIKQDALRKLKGGGNKRKKRSRKIQKKVRKRRREDVFS